MEELIVDKKIRLDTKFSAIFCDEKYIYLQNKNNKYLKVYNHYLDDVKTIDVFIDCDSICFDTINEVFVILKSDNVTKISILDKDFKMIKEKTLKLNSLPNKISYCKRTNGLYLYTENTIMEFSVDDLKLRKIINPYKEEYTPIVNNNFDFNLWENQNKKTLKFDENYKILDVTSYDNNSIFMLNIVGMEYYLYKCGLNDKYSNVDANSMVLESLEVIENLDNLDLNSYICEDTLSLNEDLEVYKSPDYLDSYLRGRTYNKQEKHFNENDEKLNLDKFEMNYKKINHEEFEMDKGCKKNKCSEHGNINNTDDCRCKKHGCKEHCGKCDDCNNKHCIDKWNDCGNKDLDGLHGCEKSCDTEKSCCEVIHSVALVELSISHILNAEGEKIQKVVKCSNSICDILETNNSVLEVIEKVTRLEDILCCKLKTVKDICNNEKRRFNK